MTTEEVKSIIASADQVDETFRAAIVVKVDEQGQMAIAAYGLPVELIRVFDAIYFARQ